jgi:hypothetical protein
MILFHWRWILYGKRAGCVAVGAWNRGKISFSSLSPATVIIIIFIFFFCRVRLSRVSCTVSSNFYLCFFSSFLQVVVAAVLAVVVVAAVVVEAEDQTMPAVAAAVT